MTDLINELFANGNYTEVVFKSSPDRWETYAAMGLIGKTEEALLGLNQFENREARFYSGVANWINGDDEKAIDIFKKLESNHAKNMLDLISKPRIHVLSQLPSVTRAPHNIAGALRDSKFELKNIGFRHHELPAEPYGNIHKYYNKEKHPDFYVCQMAEWHLIPPNIQELSCPIIAQTTDYDVHIQTVYPWLQLFDEIVVADGAEWQAVSKLVKSTVSTFPKSFGISDALPPVNNKERNIDFFISGTIIDPYYPDKAIVLNRILSVPDINMKIVNGFIEIEEYNRLLSNSKVTFTYYRRPGGIPTRGLDALSLGCAIVVQRESSLRLFLNEEQGVFNYDLSSGDIDIVIKYIISSWKDIEKKVKKGSDIIRREFGMSRVASQYMRFLTFLASKPRKERNVIPQEDLSHKRVVLMKGWQFPGTVRKLMREKNINKWKVKWNEKKKPHIIIDMTRELMLEYITENRNEYFLFKMFNMYKKGLKAFPFSIVLRFNLIRTSLHFGNQDDIIYAIYIAQETVNMSNLSVDNMEDVFPWDFCSSFFDYRYYFDIITEAIMSGSDMSSQLIKIILSSIHYYLSFYTDELENSKKAFELNPNFAFYKLNYAEKLMKSDSPEKWEKAKILLEELCCKSFLFAEAYNLLKKMDESQFSQEIKQLIPVWSKLEKEIVTFVSGDIKTLKKIKNESTIMFGKIKITREILSNEIPKISIILIACRNNKNYILKSLLKQTLPREDYEIVFVDLYGQPDHNIVKSVNLVITSLKKDTFSPHYGYNMGLLYAKGNIITIIDSNAVVPDNFLETAITSFGILRGPKVLTYHEKKVKADYNENLMDINELKRYEYIDLWDKSGAFSFRRIDAFRLGGFDESYSYKVSAPYELLWRFINSGMEEVKEDGKTCIYYFKNNFSEGSSFFYKMWNNILIDDYSLTAVETFSCGRILPLKENREVHKYRLYERNIGNEAEERYAWMTEQSGFTKKETFSLYISPLTEPLIKKVNVIKDGIIFRIKLTILSAMRKLFGPNYYILLKSKLKKILLRR